MDVVNEFYQNLLAPFDMFKESDEDLHKYFKRTCSAKDGRSFMVLLEYESANTGGKKRSWVGAYYGIKHKGKGNGLKPEELNFIKTYFQTKFLAIHHPGESFENIFLPGFEVDNNDDEHWDFWIRVRENCLEEVPIAINTLTEALGFLNLRKDK